MKKAVIFVVLAMVLIVSCTQGSNSAHGYSGSKNSMQVFKNRFNEIKNDSEFAKMSGGDDMPGAYRYFGNYAGSQNSIQVFKNRFNEIKNDGEFAKMSRGDDMPGAYRYY